VTRPATQPFISMTLDPKSLETRRDGARIFFSRDVQPVILEACRRQQISFDTFASKMGSNRAAMVLILKGHDAVSPNMLGRLRDFVAAAQGNTAGISTAA